MKLNCKLYILTIFINTILSAQPNKFEGIWEGKIEVGVNLRIGFNIKADSAGNLVTTMDSPDQGGFNIPTDYTYTRNDSIFTGIDRYKVSVSGKLTSDSTFSGIFTQTASVPLHLKKVKKLHVASRPQTPVPPFSYNSEEVSYGSVKGVQISGTLTSPRIDPNVRFIKAPVFPAILLISGSGPQNRDEEIMGHRPFAVIADHLTKKGFIVLRVDDRGTGKTTGDFEKATSADFADDVTAGINYLRKRQDVDTGKIGMLGHSEGGMIAQIVAAKRKDIDFLILMAGPGIKPIDLMTEQNIAMLHAAGISKEAQNTYGPLYKNISLAIVNAKDSIASVKAANKAFHKWQKGKDITTLQVLGLGSETEQKKYISNMVATLTIPWFRFFLKYDPAPLLKKLNVKALILNGDKDIQVLSKSNLAGMEAGLKRSASTFEIHEISGVNHLFQNCKTCTIAEYNQIEETISPKVLELIGNWLVRKVM